MKFPKWIAETNAKLKKHSWEIIQSFLPDCSSEALWFRSKVQSCSAWRAERWLRWWARAATSPLDKGDYAWSTMSFFVCRARCAQLRAPSVGSRASRSQSNPFSYRKKFRHNTDARCSLWVEAPEGSCRVLNFYLTISRSTNRPNSRTTSRASRRRLSRCILCFSFLKRGENEKLVWVDKSRQNGLWFAYRKSRSTMIYSCYWQFSAWRMLPPSWRLGTPRWHREKDSASRAPVRWRRTTWWIQSECIL